MMTAHQKLELQRKAMSGYPDDYANATLTDHMVEEEGALDGDTLALFVWREVGESSSAAEAHERIIRAVSELLDVALALTK